MEKQTMTYSDFFDMVQALSLAVNGSLMSHEDARFILRRHLIQTGWKESVEAKIEKSKK